MCPSRWWSLTTWVSTDVWVVARGLRGGPVWGGQCLGGGRKASLVQPRRPAHQRAAGVGCTSSRLAAAHFWALQRCACLSSHHTAPRARPAADGSEVQAALARVTGRSTVPQVFVGGKHVGGCDGE